MVSGRVCRGADPRQPCPFDGPAEVEIGLIATPIHYDLLLPLTDDLRTRFVFANAAGVGVDDPAAGWLLVGWGARDFYATAGRYSDISYAAVAKAIIGDRSVLRIEAWPAGPLDQFAAATPLRLTKPGYEALLTHILAERDPSAPGFPGLTGTDAFFPAQSRFNALNTCNVWMGRALRAAGVPAGSWTPPPQSLRLALGWTG